MSEWFEYYGLDRDPFAEGGVQGLFYPGASRQETVEQLLHLARFSQATLLIAGPAGAGKSAVARHFASQSSQDTRCCILEIGILEGPEQILRRLLHAFGVVPGGTPSLVGDLQQFEAFCERCKGEGHSVWVVMDDAHHMNQEAMELMLPLTKVAHGMVRLVLCAEPEWVAVLRQRLPAEVLLHSLELPALDRGESYAYLHYRLKTAGLESEPPLTAMEFDALHRQSAGLPGRINALARQALIDAAGTLQRPLSALPIWHLAVVAATLLALLLLYAWSSFRNDEDQIPVASTTGELPQSFEIAGSQRDESSLPEPESESGTAPSGDGAVSGGTPVPDASRNHVSAELLAGSTDAEKDDGRQQRDGAVMARQQAEPLPEAEPPDAVTAGLTPGRESGQARSSLNEDEQYLLELKSGLYALQLMASDNRQSVEKFVSEQNLELRLFRKIHQGKIWYVALLGAYERQDAAKAALDALPESFARRKPWIRSLESIQREIREAQAADVENAIAGEER